MPPTVAEPWYVARLTWEAVCAALLPIPLREVDAVLRRFVAHLQRANERGRRPRQRDTTRGLFNPGIQPVASLASAGGA